MEHDILVLAINLAHRISCDKRRHHNEIQPYQGFSVKPLNVRVLYFAALRDAIGKREEEVELPSLPTTVEALRQHLARQHGDGELATFKNLRCAVNYAVVPFDTSLEAGDEVAFFPPVTGG